MSSINEINNEKKHIEFKLKNSSVAGEYLRKIKEINDGNLLLLFDHSFIVLDAKTRKIICKIEGISDDEGVRYYDNIFYDLIELKNNNDLILWSSGKIFYYKKSDNKYELSQVINEVKQQKNVVNMYQIGYVEEYDLYNLVEFENNIIISCNSIGIKIYNYIDKEYKLEKVIPMFLDVENIIKIKDNNFLVIHHYIYNSGGCMPDTYHEMALSLFDLKSNQKDVIFKQETPRSRTFRINYRFNYFLIEDNFIYQICDFPSDYDLEYYKERYEDKKKELSFNFNVYNIKTGKNNLNLDISFRLICHFKDNLVFAQDYQNLYVCIFNDSAFNSIYKFDFNNSKLCILKNNDLIIFGEYGNSICYYNHYQYLLK